MEDNKVLHDRNTKKWLEGLSKGLGHELNAITHEGLKVVKVQNGFIRCDFVVTDRVSDADGNWHVGAMATLIDNVGVAAIFSFIGQARATLDFSISYFSTAKIHEEVELEAKIIGDKGSITSVMIEVRRKGNGELIALGKQWLASQNNASRVSKLFSELSRSSKL